MGLASSQARLLNLTSRMHDIEYKAQKLEAQKLQMANESTQVYQEYENALNTTKLQLKKINDDGSAAYVDASYENLTEAGYYITMLGTGLNANASKLIVTSDDVSLYNNLAVKSAEKFAAIKSGMCEEKTVGGVDCVTLAGTNNICIFTVDDLKKYAGNSSPKILMNDLEVDTTTANLGTLKGDLDGNGHTIKVTGTTALFGFVENATVSNLNLELDINSTNRYIGGLATNASGNVKVENVNLAGSIISNNPEADVIGGLFVGATTDSNVTIDNVTSYVDITQTKDSIFSESAPHIGGLVGYVGNIDLTITDSIYNGSISSVGGGRVGGLVGVYTVNDSSKNLVISNCSTAGSIQTSGAGYATVTTKIRVYADGDKATTTYANGVRTTITPNKAAGLTTVVTVKAYQEGDAESVNGTEGNAGYEKVDIKRAENYYAGGIIGQIGNDNAKGSMEDIFTITNNESSMSIDISGELASSNASGIVGYIYNTTQDATFIDGTNQMTGVISNNYSENAQLSNSVSTSAGADHVSQTKYTEGYNSQNTTDIYDYSRNNTTYNYTGTMQQTSTSTSTCTATGAKTSTSHDHKESSQYNYYLKIGEAIKSGNYIVAENYKNVNNSTWLSEMLNSAYILLSKMDSDNNVFEVNVATDTSLQEVSDETLLKKAEAKYEADMRKINQKDKKFDTDLAAMDAERNAVKTEMDTLKSVAKENVDRTFKLFG